ncbi:hypothetical protein HYV89_02485 [Candidatus Woesearchaeota archaeon]|nr:hypothetical protein [Candidatus Woesearchaeota archaeon]
MQSFKKKLIHSKELIKESFGILKRDKSLWAVPLLSFFSLLILVPLIFVISLPLLKFENEWIFAYVFLFLLIVYFVSTFFNAALTWMIWQVKQGKDATIGEGIRRALKNILDVLLFSITTLIVSMLAAMIRGGRRQEGLGGLGREVGASTLETSWNVLGSLVMPAMIIPEHHYFEAWAEVKEYRKTIPQVLVGHFGLGIIFSLAMVVAVLIMIGISLASPLAGLVVFVALIVPLIILNLLVRTTYFTLLYVYIKK